MADVLFAIQNGGFSGAIMPQNIVVGDEAEEVARFVAKYAGDRTPKNRRAPASDSPVRQGISLRAPAMLDLKLIRSDPERVKAALARRGAAERVDELLALDARRRELLPRDRGRPGRAQDALQADRRGEARRRRGEPTRLPEAGRGLKERSRPARPSWRRSRPSSSASPPPSPTCPTPTPPTG